MLLHTHVYLVDKPEEGLDFIPHDHSTDEIAPATIKVSAIEMIYPLDEEHTQVCTSTDRMKVKTTYDYILTLMKQEDSK